MLECFDYSVIQFEGPGGTYSFYKPSVDEAQT
jgi:hypothetical protein